MLKGKGALITGSTQGLGYAMAQRLAAEGCNVMLNGFGDGAEIERKRRQLEESHGVRAFHHGADLAEPRQIAALVDAAKSSLGAVDILINNAVVRHFAPIETFRPEDWDKALAVNLSAAFHTARLVLPGMRARNLRQDRQHLLDLRPGRRGQSGRLRHDQDGADRLHPRRGARDGGAGHHLQRDLSRHGPDTRHRGTAGGLHGKGGPGARGGREGFHGLAPTLGTLRGAGGRRGARRLALRTGRPRHHRRGHSDRRRLERELALSGPVSSRRSISGSDTMPSALDFLATNRRNCPCP